MTRVVVYEGDEQHEIHLSFGDVLIVQDNGGSRNLLSGRRAWRWRLAKALRERDLARAEPRAADRVLDELGYEWPE